MTSRKPISHGTFKPRFDGCLAADEVMETIKKKCKCDIIMSQGKGCSSTVVLLPHAWDNLAATTHYGKWTPENELESQYFFEGYYFNDQFGNTTTVVTHVLSTLSASRERCFAQLYDEKSGTNAYSDLQDQEEHLTKYSSAGRVTKTGAELNPFFKNYGTPHKVGFGHTHPNLGVFFSTTDRTSVFAPDGEPWLTAVIDPRRCELLFTSGKELEKCNLIIMGDKKSSAEQITVLPPETEEQCKYELEPDRELKLDLDHSSLPELATLLKEIINNEDLRFDFRLNGKFPGKGRVRLTITKKDT